MIVLFDVQYQYVRFFSSSSGIWLDAWYVECTDRNIKRFCLFGKWGFKVTPIVQN